MCVLAYVGLSACSTDSSGPTDVGNWHVSSVAASPAGDAVAFVGRSGSGTDYNFRAALTGSPPTVLGPNEGYARSVAWLPGGTAMVLIYATELSGDSPDKLAVVDLNGESRAVPLHTQLLSSAPAAVTSDGRRAIVAAQRPSLYLEQTDLWAIDLQSGAATQLTDTPEIREDNPHLVTDTTILITVSLGDREQQPSGSLVLFDIESGTRRTLTPPSQIVGASTTDPSGEYAIYDAFGADRTQRALWAVSMATPKAPTLIADEPVRNPTVASDGAILALRPSEGPGETTIARIVVREAPWA